MLGGNLGSLLYGDVFVMRCFKRSLVPVGRLLEHILFPPSQCVSQLLSIFISTTETLPHSIFLYTNLAAMLEATDILLTEFQLFRRVGVTTVTLTGNKATASIGNIASVQGQTANNPLCCRVENRFHLKTKSKPCQEKIGFPSA